MKLWERLIQLARPKDTPEHLRRGKLGEKAARRHLRRLGLKFLLANFRSSRGEIDLIFREGDSLVFVEVKSRSSEEWTRPAAAVNAAKRRRLSQAALDYLQLLDNPSGLISWKSCWQTERWSRSGICPTASRCRSRFDTGDRAAHPGSTDFAPARLRPGLPILFLDISAHSRGYVAHPARRNHPFAKLVENGSRQKPRNSCTWASMAVLLLNWPCRRSACV
jgi:uncharacterized protein (TIGR00252 family)